MKNSALQRTIIILAAVALIAMFHPGGIGWTTGA